MTAAKQRLSVEQYLEREAQASERSEYLAGEVLAMVGSTVLHNQLSLNIASALKTGLQGKPCRVFMADVRLRVAAADAYFYPDVFVVCGPSLPAPNALSATDAQLIVEVLSDSTGGYDRAEKLHAYRKLPGLKEYVLVSQAPRRVEIYRRGPDVGWTFLTLEGDDIARLESVGVELPLPLIYEGTGV